jgi:hypothetical protein
MFNINPLDVLNQRKLNFIPVHFAKTKLHYLGEANEIEDWILKKLKGRYAYVKAPDIDKDGHLKTATFVAFEDQKEITYFMLACPYLRRI